MAKHQVLGDDRAELGGAVEQLAQKVKLRAEGQIYRVERRAENLAAAVFQWRFRPEWTLKKKNEINESWAINLTFLQDRHSPLEVVVGVADGSLFASFL